MADGLNEMEAHTGKLAETYKTKLDTLRALKQSLLQKAFSGELTTVFNPDAVEH